MAKEGIIILGDKDREKGHGIFGETVDIKELLTEPGSGTLGKVGALYDHVSNPEVHIKDKINSLLKLHMFFSREMLTSPEITIETIGIYRARREAVNDLKRMVEVLNEYSAVDNFDVEHPLFNKSLTFVIEAILVAIKANTDTSQFDSIVREVAISLPTVESRIKNIVQDSSTEEILALRENPLMDSLNAEKSLFKEYLTNRDEFLAYMENKAR